MDKSKNAGPDGQLGEPKSPLEGHGRRSLELGRSEVNLEFLKRFGGIAIPGVGRVSLLYRNPIRGKVTVHFDPSDELIAYLAKENGHGDGKELSIGESDSN